MTGKHVFLIILIVLAHVGLVWGQGDPNLVGYWNFDDQAVTENPQVRFCEGH